MELLGITQQRRDCAVDATKAHLEVCVRCGELERVEEGDEDEGADRAEEDECQEDKALALRSGAAGIRGVRGVRGGGQAGASQCDSQRTTPSTKT